jgi:uncharacterized protein (DUF885 family)
LNSRIKAITPGANASFDRLQREFYRAWFRFHPEEAASAGLETYAELLRTYNDDDIGALESLDQKLLSALDEIDADDLDHDRYIDYCVLKSAVSVELHDLQELDWRFRNPMVYVPVHAIYQLLIHPVNDVQKAIKHRLQAIPEYLRGARTLLQLMPERVVPVWLQSAIEQCEIGAGFIRNLGRHPLIAEKFSNPARLQPLFDDASHALNEFAHFLQRDIANRAAGNFAVGEERFNRLLSENHFLDVGADELLAFGERMFDESEAGLKAQAESMQQGTGINELLTQIRARHPGPEKLLDSYRQRIREAHEWLQQNDLVSLPVNESLHVQDTPAFLKPLIPFAAYEPPVPMDQEQRGLYYVTTSSDPALLAEHNHYSIDLTCVHESFPGHHLQFVTANSCHADNMTRSVHASASLYEGWALYCEDLMQEQGFLDKQEHRFIMLRDRLWRALRVIIDVSLHVRGMSLDEAASLMVDRLGFDRRQADAEVAWYSATPTVPLCYASGYALIKAVREHQQQQPGFELRVFHDALLGQGSIALPLVIKRAFGEDAWKYARGKVFSGK